MEKIISKAWYVWVDPMIGEYPFFSISDLEPVLANTPSEAKSKANFSPSDYKNDYGDYCTFIDIRVRRAKQYDKIEFNGAAITRKSYEYMLKQELRNTALRELPDHEMYYVQDKRTYVGNSVVWWEQDRNGYTSDITRAHKFTKEEILKSFINGRDTDIVWMASHIEKNIKSHVDAQYLNSKYSL